MGLGLMDAPEVVTYRSVEVCRLAGCTYRAFDYWCRTGVFPGNGGANGSGSRRYGFTGDDVKVARALWRLSVAGLCGGGARSGAAPRPITRFVPAIRTAVEAGARRALIPLGRDVTVWVDLTAEGDR